MGEGKDKNIFFGFEAKIFHLVGIGPRKCGFPFFPDNLNDKYLSKLKRKTKLSFLLFIALMIGLLLI